MSTAPEDVTSGISVVVPNWNRSDLLRRVLRHLRAQTMEIREIVVVDDGSTDGSADAARAEGARVIELGENRGFTVAVNRGIAEVRTEFVAVVNNDVQPAPDWLANLAGAMRQPRIWFAVGKLRSASRPDELDGTFDALCRGACPWRAGNGRKDGPLWDRRRRIRFASWTAALFRTELFRLVGGLDEQFGSYLEDVDFGLRCVRHGCYGLYVPNAIATHEGSATLGQWNKEVVRCVARNQVLLVAKHYPARYLLRYGWPILVAQTLWGALAAAHGQPAAFVRGKAEGLALFLRIRCEVVRTGGWPRGLSKVLEESESEIFRLQKRSGFDLYWRLYFALTCLA